MVSPNQLSIDRLYMLQALWLAKAAGQCNEVPVGAVVVLDDRVIGRGMNQCVVNHDPSAHAEVQALREAAQYVQSSRIDGATLYVSLEPCLMCCGALLQSRISRVVFGAREPKTGGIVSIHEALTLPNVEPHVSISEGIYANEAKELLRAFFKQRR